MAILAIFSGPMTPSQYDTLRYSVDWTRDQPVGGIVHAAAFDDAGHIHVADVWESREALDAFVTGRLMPVMATLKIQPPHVEVFPLHNLQAYHGIGTYRI